MKCDWKTYSLGELVSFTSGRTPSKKKEEYWSGNIPWISAKTLKDERISTSDLFISEEALKAGSKLAPVGSILLLTRGSGLFNGIPIGLVESEVAFNQDIKCLYSCTDIENKYIFYWLLSQKSYLMAKVGVTGIGAGKFDLDFLQKLEVPVPSKILQQRIVAIAESISQKIITNNKINDNLQQQVSALYKSWYQDYSMIGNDELIQTEYGLIPKGWHFELLGDLCKSVSVTHNFQKEQLVFLNTGDIEDGRFLHSDYMSVTEMPGQAKKTIKPGDILYSEIRPINRHFAYVNFPSDDYVVSTKLMVIRSSSIDDRRLYQYLTSDAVIGELQMQAESRSGTFPQIRFDNIARLPILIADDKTENAFIDLLHSVYDQIEYNNKENEQLSTLRDTLLPKLMSGEIDIANVQL